MWEKLDMAWHYEKIVGSGKKWIKNDQVVGAVTKPLFPLGSKLNKADTNTMIQNCPRKAGSVISLRLGYNAHSGCLRGASCNFAREYFGWKNLNWCVEAELLRLGGFRKRRKMLVDAVEINALVNELRDKNMKYHGEQTDQWKDWERPQTKTATVGKKVVSSLVKRSEPDHSTSLPSTESNVDSPERKHWEVDDEWKEHIATLANKNFSFIPGDFSILSSPKRRAWARI